MIGFTLNAPVSFRDERDAAAPIRPAKELSV